MYPLHTHISKMTHWPLYWVYEGPIPWTPD